jgi:ABC-2 type transport system ATP-binding protein
VLAELEALTGLDSRQLVCAVASAFALDVVETADMLLHAPAFDLLPLPKAMQRHCVLLRDSHAGVLGVIADPFDPDLQTWLERVDIADAADRSVKGYSVGMKQRLGLAAALMTRPKAVILDEPTSGMDPVGFQQMRELIRELADKDGVTIILASHQLDEVQRLCDRVAILSKGRLATEGPVAALTAAGLKLRIEATPIDKVLTVLGERGRPDGATAALADVTREQAPQLIRVLVGDGVDVLEARWVGGELESAFRFHTGGPDAG